MLRFKKLLEITNKMKFIIYIIIFKSINISDEIILKNLKNDWIKRNVL